MDKILIFGINGFIGSHFLDYIQSKKLSENFKFIGADLNINKQEKNDYFQYIKIDLLSADNVKHILFEVKPDYIINLAGVFGNVSYEKMINTNVEISRLLFEGVISHGLKIKNILLIGSAAEYGKADNLPLVESTELSPINNYGLSKGYQYYLAKFYCNNYQIPYSIARTFNTYGKGLSVDLSIGSFMKQIENAQNGDSIIVGNIETKRDFLEIPIVIDYFWKILLSGKPNEIYNVCSGYSVTIRSILEMLIKESGKELSIVVDQSRIKKFDVMDIYGDNSKLLSL